MTIFFIITCIATTACGFRPLYQTGTTLSPSNSTVLDQVAITAAPGANGLMLRNALIDRFYHHGYPDQAPYILEINLQELYRDLIIQKNDTTTRAQLVMRAFYTLKDKNGTIILDSGDIRAVSSYNILQSQYTTLVTQAQARENTIRELADKITTRIAVVLEKKTEE